MTGQVAATTRAHGNILAHLHDPFGSAACASRMGLDHNTLARQMVGERLLHGLAPIECANLHRLVRRLLGADGIIRSGGLPLMKAHSQSTG